MEPDTPYDPEWATRRPSRGLIAAVLVAILMLLFGGAYFASPYLAMNALKDAAKHGEQDRLAQEIDFPAVRASLRSQLASALMARLQSDGQTRNSPLAQFGALLLPTLAEGVVDAFVTPSALSALANGGAPALPTPRPKAAATGGPASASPPPAPKARPVYTQAYVSLNLFRVTITAAPASDPVVFSFRRHALFGWTLFDIVLPPSALQGLPTLDQGDLR